MLMGCKKNHIATASDYMSKFPHKNVKKKQHTIQSKKLVSHNSISRPLKKERKTKRRGKTQNGKKPY